MIVVSDLNKSYVAGSTRAHVLWDVHFQVQAGQYVAIMGASGSGKSTLLNVLGLLDDYDSGHYTLDGQDTRGLSDETAARLRNRTIGFVFQSFHLLPHKRLWENVALPLIYAGMHRRERRQRACELLGRLGLGERVQDFPYQLSGGQQQRVAIARALVTDPALILADEPTGNLDSETSAEVLNLFAEIHAQGRTVLLVTHQVEVAQAAQRVVHVRDGTVVSDASSGAVG